MVPYGDKDQWGLQDAVVMQLVESTWSAEAMDCTWLVRHTLRPIQAESIWATLTAALKEVSKIYRFQKWGCSVTNNTTTSHPQHLLSSFKFSPWNTRPNKNNFFLCFLQSSTPCSPGKGYVKVKCWGLYFSVDPWVLCTMGSRQSNLLYYKKRNEVSILVCQNSKKQKRLGCCKETRAPALQKLQADSQTMVSFLQHHCLRWKYEVRLWKISIASFVTQIKMPIAVRFSKTKQLSFTQVWYEIH